ncbi:MAG: hypothetical protein KO464_09025 [Candidatus Methanofastidiosum sp.]|nr:hypothetical protein [Methanofastidiosum sp.]
MTKSDKKEIMIRLPRSDYATLQEMKDDEGLVQDTEMIMRIISHELMRYRIKKETA